MAVTAALLSSCGGAKTTTAEADKFDYTVEQFADLQILRYKVPGFEELTLKQKELIYYLTEAARSTSRPTPTPSGTRSNG